MLVPWAKKQVPRSVVGQFETVGFCFQPQPRLMPLLQHVMHRPPARERLLSLSGSPLGRAASLALAHAASGLPRLSIACAQCQAQAVKRQGKKGRPSEDTHYPLSSKLESSE